MSPRDAPAPPVATASTAGAEALLPVPVRALLYACGALCLLLGIVGVVVPGLPTTVFVLAAAACFARASPRAHAWLLASRLFGPIIRNWEQHRAVTRKVKRSALGLMALTVAFSLWALAARPWLQLAALAGVSIGIVSVARLPVREEDDSPAARTDT